MIHGPRGAVWSRPLIEKRSRLASGQALIAGAHVVADRVAQDVEAAAPYIAHARAPEHEHELELEIELLGDRGIGDRAARVDDPGAHLVEAGRVRRRLGDPEALEVRHVVRPGAHAFAAILERGEQPGALERDRGPGVRQRAARMQRGAPVEDRSLHGAEQLRLHPGRPLPSAARPPPQSVPVSSPPASCRCRLLSAPNVQRSGRMGCGHLDPLEDHAGATPSAPSDFVHYATILAQAARQAALFGFAILNAPRTRKPGAPHAAGAVSAYGAGGDEADVVVGVQPVRRDPGADKLE